MGLSLHSDWPKNIRTLGIGILVLIFLIFLVALVPQLVGADRSFVVRSDSMSPAIDAGSVVVVSEADPASISTGDVITYEGSSGAPVTHRVVEIHEDDGRQFTTKGDANENPDSQPIPGTALLGRVSFHVPLIGYVIAFAGTDLGLIALVVIPAALLLVLEVRDILQSDGDSEGEPEP